MGKLSTMASEYFKTANMNGLLPAKKLESSLRYLAERGQRAGFAIAGSSFQESQNSKAL